MANNDFTDRERTIMQCAWLCFEEQPKVDYVKLAGLVGMSNPRSATNAWLAIRKKLAAQTGPTAPTSSTDGGDTAAPTKTTTKRKGKDGSPKATPAKKGRKSKKAQAEEDEEEEHGSSKIEQNQS